MRNAKVRIAAGFASMRGTQLLNEGWFVPPLQGGGIFVEPFPSGALRFHWAIVDRSLREEMRFRIYDRFGLHLKCYFSVSP